MNCRGAYTHTHTFTSPFIFGLSGVYFNYARQAQQTRQVEAQKRGTVYKACKEQLMTQNLYASHRRRRETRFSTSVIIKPE